MIILPYLQNLSGVTSLNDEDYENIKHPYAEMYFHVTLKTVQLGTTLGALVIAPAIAALNKNKRNITGLRNTMIRSGKVGCLIGIVTGNRFSLALDIENDICVHFYTIVICDICDVVICYVVMIFYTGPLMTYKKFQDQSEESVYDRAFRMRKNPNQLRCDRAYFGGAGIGLITSMALSSNPVLGTLLGSTVSLIGMGIYNNKS